MKNYQLFTPSCGDEHLEGLVRRYALRDVFDGVGYRNDDLLRKQREIYESWLAWAKATYPAVRCGFYEWMLRDADLGFIFRPGDLVKHGDTYCVVAGRNPPRVAPAFRVEGSEVRQEDAVRTDDYCVLLRDPLGKTRTVNVESADLMPADIPPEVFMLACGKAKDCPMMKGE